MILLRMGSAQALTSEIDPVRIMDGLIKDRDGVRGVAYDFVPTLEGELRGDVGRTAAVSFLKDFEDVVTGAASSGFSPQSSRMSRSARFSERRMRGWRPSPRARVRSSKSFGTR